MLALTLSSTGNKHSTCRVCTAKHSERFSFSHKKARVSITRAFDLSFIIEVILFSHDWNFITVERFTLHDTYLNSAVKTSLPVSIIRLQWFSICHAANT